MNRNEPSPFNQDTYQTGSVSPPKSRGGLVAFLLVLVIFLCGLSTALGLMNVRLFRALNRQKDAQQVEFSGARQAEYTKDTVFPGFSGRDIPEIFSLYQDLPQGIYVTEVSHAKGIRPGDILLQIDGTDVTAPHQLQELLRNKSTAPVVLYRNGKTLESTLITNKD